MTSRERSEALGMNLDNAVRILARADFSAAFDHEKVSRALDCVIEARALFRAGAKIPRDEIREQLSELLDFAHQLTPGP